MKRARSLLLVIVLPLLTLLTGVAPAHALQRAHPTHRPASISGPLQEELRALNRRGMAGHMVAVEVESTRDMAQTVRALGGRVEADVAGRLLAARVSADRVPDLARQSGAGRLFGSQRLHLALDKSVPDIRANLAWGLHDGSGLPVRGNHVLVGIVDSGIDWRNPDFKNPDGSTRIKFIWDQTEGNRPPAGFDFGYECDSASIDAGQCPEADTDGHGTHVSGIAAGNGLSGNPPTEIGVAPETDIIVVKSSLDTDKIIAAWKYLIGKAQQLGEPIVINDSFGNQLEPHDGSDPTSQAVDLLSGPGHIFVASAGNEAHQSIHTSGTVGQGGTATIEVDAHGHLPTLQFAAFYAPQDTMSATLTKVDTGETFGPVNVGEHIDQVKAKDGETAVTVDATPFDDQHRAVYVELDQDRGVTGQWRLSLSGTTIVDSGRYDAWLSGENGGDQEFANPDESDTVASPADAHSIISVGAYATRVTWTDADNQEHDICGYLACAANGLSLGQISLHSSEGPTADGRQKPDISAPGILIMSSRSQDVPVCSESRGDKSCFPPILLAPGGHDVLLSGTSMSAPHVTGTIALMLQVNPTLGPQTVDGILRSTARHDQFTGSDAWTPDYGAGKLDAYAAVQAAMAASSATPTPSPTATPVPSTATPTAAPALAFSIASLQVQTAAGKPVKAVKVGQQVRLAMYVSFSSFNNVRVTTGWKVTTGGSVVGRRTTSHTLNWSDARTQRWSWQFVPKRAGRYRFLASVTANGRIENRALSFTVQPGKGFRRLPASLNHSQLLYSRPATIALSR